MDKTVISTVLMMSFSSPQFDVACERKDSSSGTKRDGKEAGMAQHRIPKPISKNRAAQNPANPEPHSEWSEREISECLCQGDIPVLLGPWSYVAEVDLDCYTTVILQRQCAGMESLNSGTDNPIIKVMASEGGDLPRSDLEVVKCHATGMKMNWSKHWK